MSKDKAFEEVSPFAFNPFRDISPVDQFGFIDLHDAFVNNCIPGDISIQTEEYNGVEDPSSLLGKSSDVFDAFRKAEYVKSAEASAAAARAAAATEGATE